MYNTSEFQVVVGVLEECGRDAVKALTFGVMECGVIKYVVSVYVHLVLSLCV